MNSLLITGISSSIIRLRVKKLMELLAVFKVEVWKPWLYRCRRKSLTVVRESGLGSLAL